MTVGGREFYVYRYEGKFNDIPNAAVILSYPKEAFGNPRALRVFISTNAELSTQEIFLCDSWYTSVKVMDSFIQKGFYTIGALKTNRIIYPFGIRQKSQRFCPSFTKNRYGRQPCDRWRT